MNNAGCQVVGIERLGIRSLKGIISAETVAVGLRHAISGFLMSQDRGATASRLPRVISTLCMGNTG